MKEANGVSSVLDFLMLLCPVWGMRHEAEFDGIQAYRLIPVTICLEGF